MDKVLIICGPTGTGKTKLAINLAKKFDGELVNADSRQVYKGLDALTGKDRSEEVPIWLYDVVDAGEEFSVAHFVRLAHAAIADIHKRKKLPIIVGGTGFYLKALTQKIDTLLIPPNKKLRKRIADAPRNELQKELAQVDPGKWNKMNYSDRQNPRRLIRAIEVAVSAAEHRILPVGNALWVGLTAALPQLRKRIAQRVGERFEGAVAEVRPDLPPILGVTSLLSYLRTDRTKEEAIKKWAQAEYDYARRQMTWFRKEKAIKWHDIADPNLRQKVEERVTRWYTA